MRVEGVERPDERVVGVERRVLQVEEQRQAIGLVAIEGVIAPQGEVEPGDEEERRPSRQARSAIGARPQTSAPVVLARRTSLVGSPSPCSTLPAPRRAGGSLTRAGGSVNAG